MSISNEKPKYNWADITKEDVMAAIKLFTLGHTEEYKNSQSTFLAYDGQLLPAKHIRGMAYKIHFGTEISKSEYAGGMETVKFFSRLGFKIHYTGPLENKIKKVALAYKADKKPVRMERKKEYAPQPKVTKTEQIPKSKDGKITISAKRVIEQKNALQLILNKMFDGDIVCEKTYPWLRTPETIEGPYKRIYDVLHEYRGDDKFAKKSLVLRCDYVCESQKLVIEYDERQHFSEARRLSLEAYPNIDLGYDKTLWIKVCRDIQAKDNAPKNRDEGRAYYDSTRDIECANHGYKLVRIMHGQIDFEKDGAADELRKLIFDNK